MVVATENHADPEAARRLARDWGWRAWTGGELEGMLQGTGFVRIALQVRDGTVFAAARKPPA